jgi:hypothetical protein
MDPLPVFTGIGELVDTFLRNFKPITNANFFADVTREFRDVSDLPSCDRGTAG